MPQVLSINMGDLHRLMQQVKDSDRRYKSGQKHRLHREDELYVAKSVQEQVTIVEERKKRKESGGYSHEEASKKAKTTTK